MWTKFIKSSSVCLSVRGCLRLNWQLRLIFQKFPFGLKGRVHWKLAQTMRAEILCTKVSSFEMNCDLWIRWQRQNKVTQPLLSTNNGIGAENQVKCKSAGVWTEQLNLKLLPSNTSFVFTSLTAVIKASSDASFPDSGACRHVCNCFSFTNVLVLAYKLAS